MVWSSGRTELQSVGRVSEKLVQELSYSMIKTDITLKRVKFAYHLMFSRDEIDLNQLSFGISGVDTEPVR
jgi:hypothetical protein